VALALIALMLNAAAGPRVECPASCTTPDAVGRAVPPGVGASVVCRDGKVQLSLAVGNAFVIDRTVAQTPASCRDLPELIDLLLASNKVSRVAPPPPAHPKPAATPAPRPPAEAPPVPEPEPQAQAPAEAVPEAPAPPPAPEAEPPPRAPAHAAEVVQTTPPADPPTRSFVTLDAGGGIQSGPVDGVVQARLSWSLAGARIGGFLEGGLVPQRDVQTSTFTASTSRQFAGAGASFSWRPLDRSGPRASLGIGFERVWAQGESLIHNRGDSGFGPTGNLSVEWLQRLPAGLILRGALGVTARPGVWSLAGGGPTAPIWPNAGVWACVAVGWTPSILWGL
jgi:hypothetical protein